VGKTAPDQILLMTALVDAEIDSNASATAADIATLIKLFAVFAIPDVDRDCRKREIWPMRAMGCPPSRESVAPEPFSC
jgi:hypothetical protein